MKDSQRPRIRVLLADDHAIVRAGIRALLSNIDGVQVTAEAPDGQQVLHMVGELQPDIVLMDISMPGLNGLEVTDHMTREYPNVRVVMLSMHSSEEYVLRALRAGAVGYLPKDIGPDELEAALTAVMRGQVYLSPVVAARVAGYIRRTTGNQPSEDTSVNPLERLTPRQREVLQQVAEGYTTQQIALRLGIDAKTVETHRSQIMQRLDIHDVPGLVRFAIRTGLVSPEQ